MEPNVKRPRNLKTPWPPVQDLLQVQNVTSADNWTSLQALFKRCDVWDIIYYNFATYNPEEVNWYLHEWIGCRDATPDRKNYRFGTLAGGRPMTIYIPTGDWLPPGPKQAEARQAALAILRDPKVLNLHFKAGLLELRAGDIHGVATAISSGKITVIHRPCMGWMAQYRGGPGYNQLVIPFASAPPIGMKALMVHEAVHAAMDVTRIPETMQQAEALAYITQALYSRRNGGNLGASVPQPAFAIAPRNFVAWSGIFKLAASIAEDIDKGRPVSDVDLVGLALSITIAPTYQSEGAPPNDGV
jgi:hypothetical protein